VRKLLLALASLVGGAGAGWIAWVRIQGDSLMVYEPEALSSVSASADGRSLHGEITIANRGKVGGVVHKVVGRILDGPAGRVLVTRKGSRPPTRGWWQSNCLTPGQSCVAEVDVELDAPAEGPVTIELDTHEIGRRLVVHRTVQLTVTAPRPAAAEALTTQP
jgi:hypothetical protein